VKKNLFIIFFIISVLKGYSQTENIDSLFDIVSENQKLRLKNIFTEKRDSVFEKFDKSIEKLLNHPDFCKTSFDSSKKYFLVDKLKNETKGVNLAYSFINNIVVTNSANKKIRIFSWDDLGGGSCHYYTNYIQIPDDSGKCIINSFNASEFIPEVGYYQIEEINDSGKKVYMIIGYGTYGGGKHHWLIRFFEIKNNELVECKEYYQNYDVFIISSNRSQEIDLKINVKKKTISYKKYKYEEDAGFYTNDFEHIKLKFKNGKLNKK